MEKRERGRVLWGMALCVLCNEALYLFAHYARLPVWLDTTGTALAALMIEPTAGLLVGLVNNFFLALFQGQASTLFYYSISAAVALIVGFLMRGPDGRLRKKRAVPVILLVTAVSTLLSGLLGIWRSGGVPSGNTEGILFRALTARGVPAWLAIFGAVGPVKLLDTVATAAIVALLYCLLRRRFGRPED